MGRPGLAPGMYFRLLLMGYFEGLDSERGMAWRAADSLALRSFLRIGLEEAPPDHSTVSRTRRLIDVETHREVFTWALGVIAEKGLLQGKTLGIDATTLEANAALRSIVRRDSGESYPEFLTKLAKESGIATPTREEVARLDRKRKKKSSNQDWEHPHDPDARITKMKDGRTHLAHKAEHAVDLETGAVVAVTVQGADQGDTTTLQETFVEAAEQLEAVGKEPAADEQMNAQGLEEVVTDKGYHSGPLLEDLQAIGVRSYIPEPQRGRRHWQGKADEQTAVYGNRRRMRGERGKQLLASAGRGSGTKLCACLRHGRNAAHASARTSQHLKAAAASRRGVQPQPDSAPGNRSRDAKGPAGPLEQRLFLLLVGLDAPARAHGTIGSSTGHFYG